MQAFEEVVGQQFTGLQRALESRGEKFLGHLLLDALFQIVDRSPRYGFTQDRHDIRQQKRQFVVRKRCFAILRSQRHQGRG